MRFYPNDLAPFANEPTKDRFAIRKIGDQVGEGVVSLVAFNPGDLLFNFTGYITEYITQYTLKIRDGVHLHDPYFMGKVLHSCEPNATCNMQTLSFHALRKIEPGELITMDYAETEDELFLSFPCACGSAACRGNITSKNFDSVEEISREKFLVWNKP